jgi:ADP-ribose pyrophosphatase
VLITHNNISASKQIYQGQIVNLRLDEISVKNNKFVTREVVEHNGGVVVVCQPAKDKVLLIKQYRYAVDCELIELPAGRLEQAEPPLAAAQRELAEETGYLANRWTELGKIYSAPGFCNEILYFYRATEVTEVNRNLDDDEEIDVMVVSLSQAWQLALAAEVNDAKTIAGLTLLSRII